MNRIKILPENIANKIAAGEVVERPASVVKELVENALDAGARNITVETQAGGVGLIRVSDDGCGMNKDEAILSLERHATSKISSELDIGAVRTLGFRGEALPSIAAVSRFELISKPADASTAISLTVEGGKIETVKETFHQGGTTVSVRDLFHNIPARRKFLKSSFTENSHISQTIRLAALSQQEVGFRWVSDGQELIQIPGASSLRDRVARLFEREIADQIVPVDRSLGVINVFGFVGKPTLTRANRSYQFFFVNGRPVQNRILSFALKDAYHSLVMVERQPVCFVFVTLPPQDLDVNVHPAKREIRFRQDNLVRDVVRQAVRTAVQGIQDTPTIMPGDVFRSDRVREAMAKYEASGRDDSLFTPSRAGSAGRASSDGDDSMPIDGVADGQAVAAPAEPQPLRLTLVGQIHRLYLLLESQEGLVVMDQHAAHERVLFDQVLKKIRSDQIVESQRLLLPETIACDPPKAALLSQCLQKLGRLGMEIREFGKNSFIIEAVPFFMKNSDIKTTMKDIVDDLVEEEKEITFGRIHEEKVLLTLCRMAVRASDKLNPKEQEALVEQLIASENPYHCPHGRPTMLKITADYLAKQFKR